MWEPTERVLKTNIIAFNVAITSQLPDKAEHKANALTKIIWFLKAICTHIKYWEDTCQVFQKRWVFIRTHAQQTLLGHSVMPSNAQCIQFHHIIGMWVANRLLYFDEWTLLKPYQYPTSRLPIYTTTVDFNSLWTSCQFSCNFFFFTKSQLVYNSFVPGSIQTMKLIAVAI